ncbi:hypothetical protein DFH09DRAFT_1367228 [Mycena vulgaris]|nr:hypothetical protein DFH09DRAFT_1367228 [Mycena vulgaris]
MVYVRSKKFCCCLPVRFGVFVMSFLALIGGGIVSAAGWIQVGHLKENPLSKSDEIALYIVASVFTVLALIGGLGLIGVFGKKAGLVSLFGGMLNVHLGFSVLSGAFAIYSLFKNNSNALFKDDALSRCIKGSTDQHVIDTCKTAMNVTKGLIVGAYVLSWAIELYGCIIVHNYVKQLHEEMDAEARGNVVAPMAAAYAVPIPSYAFTQPVQAHGSKF